jgi:hypothetical protein
MRNEIYHRNLSSYRHVITHDDTLVGYYAACRRKTGSIVDNIVDCHGQQKFTDTTQNTQHYTYIDSRVELHGRDNDRPV